MRNSDATPVPLGSWRGTDYEVVVDIVDQMPTGLTVSDDGRIFLSFPRWGDDVRFTVGEVVDGRVVAFPNEKINTWPAVDATNQLVSVQSVIVDPAGHLWLLDTGSLAFTPYVDNGPKLVEVDLSTSEVVRTIHIDPSAMTPTTYLNDARFDLARGFAYITDSQPTGGLIVVELRSGRSWSKLRGHETTMAVKDFRAMVQGVRLDIVGGSDGIAISATGERLYYSAVSGRRLFSVSTDALVDEHLDEREVAQTIVDHGDKPASDGLETDTEGNVYATAYEHSAVIRMAPDGTWLTLMHGPCLLWPDTLSLAADGYLYLSVNQLPRTPLFNNGVDERVPPYQIIRKRISGHPIRLGGR
jgi:sugar lactone lactonase YvrE